MAEVLFQSPHANLVVSRTTYASRNFEGKPEVKGGLSFEEGWLRLDSEKDKDDVDFLEKHMGNELQGGSSFRRMKSDILGLKALEEGKTYASIPDNGVMEGDKEALKYLSNLGASLPPNAYKKALTLAVDIYKRFGLVGVPIPEEGLGQKRLRGRIIEIVATIEEQGIWHDDTNGKEDSGSGSTKD